jgi:hypothetical protein
MVVAAIPGGRMKEAHRGDAENAEERGEEKTGGLRGFDARELHPLELLSSEGSSSSALLRALRVSAVRLGLLGLRVERA